MEKEIDNKVTPDIHLRKHKQETFRRKARIT